MEDKLMNKTEIIVKVSLPIVMATGFICYKLGQYSVYIKAAKSLINDEKSKTNSED